eukprot:4737487-Pleurochrysis_carterae.AAC.4
MGKRSGSIYVPQKRNLTLRASLALRASCCARLATVCFSSMVTMRPCRALLRSSFPSSLPSARSRI